MSKMSMPFGGRTITTSVSGGGLGCLGALAPLGLLLAALAAIGWAYDAVTSPEAVAAAAARAEAGNAFLDGLVGTVAAVAGLVVLGVIGWRLLATVTLPADRAAATAYAAHVTEVEVARAERLAAVEQAAAALDEEPAPVDRNGGRHEGDGVRDGKLIDAAGRFRSLGVFPVDEPTVVDHEPVDAVVVDRALDQEA